MLTLVHKQPAGSDTHQYELTTTALDGVAGMRCVQGQLTVSASELFGGKKRIELGLRTVDAPTDVAVEPGQARGGARLSGSVIHAEVGKPFEIFFRLHGRLRITAALSAACFPEARP